MKNKIIDFKTVNEESQFDKSFIIYGEAEETFNNDIAFSNFDFKSLDEGIYEATVNNQEGYLFYFWKLNSDSRNLMYRGLLIDQEDTDAAKYAARKFNTKSKLNTYYI
jgi:hypothetical protein